MEDNSGDQPSAPPDFGQGGFSREDIDAIIRGAGASPAGTEPASARSTPDPPSEPGEISQTDIDSLIGCAGAAGDEHAATEAAAEPSPADAQSGSQTDIDALLNAANGDAGALGGGTSAEAATEAGQTTAQQSAPPPDVKSYQPQELGNGVDASVDPKRVTMLNDVKLGVRIQLGRTRMLVEDVLKLGKGSVVELDKLAGDPVEVLVNDRLIARGEVLVLNDNFCVRISEVLSHDPHRISE